MAQVREDHLGGFNPRGNPMTTYRALWQWMVSDLGVRSVVDVGCGAGHAASFFRRLGCDVLALDGSRRAGGLLGGEGFVVHDLVTGPYLCGRGFDAVWCCEVAEHIAERHVGHLLSTLVGNASRWIFFTHALPGQGGYHHVNCKPPDYWLALLSSRGCLLDESLTAQARSLAHHYFARTGLVLRVADTTARHSQREPGL